MGWVGGWEYSRAGQGGEGGVFLTWCESFDAEGRHSGETGSMGCKSRSLRNRMVVRWGGGGALLVVAIAGYALGAGAADDDVGA